MKLSETTSSDATVEETFEAHCQHSVREDACKLSGALSWDVTVEPAPDGGARIQVDRTMPAEVPDFAKKFLGDTIEVRQVEEWGPADSSGGRTARVKVTIKGQPASMVGSAVLQPSGTGSVETIEGDVRVDVPFIGKKFEPEIVRVIAKAIRIEQQTALEWIHSRR